jgi:hypothetical protein
VPVKIVCVCVCVYHAARGRPSLNLLTHPPGCHRAPRRRSSVSSPPKQTSTPPITPDLCRCTLRPARALRQRCAAPRRPGMRLLHGYCTAAYACERRAPLSTPPRRCRPSVCARTERMSMRSLGSTIPPRCTAWSVRSPSALSAVHLRSIASAPFCPPATRGRTCRCPGLSERPQVEEGHNDCLEVLVAAGAYLNARWRRAGTVLCDSCALLLTHSLAHASPTWLTTGARGSNPFGGAGRKTVTHRSTKRHGSDSSSQPSC